jgi:putative transposase
MVWEFQPKRDLKERSLTIPMYNFEYGSKFLINDSEYIVRREMGDQIEVENLSYKRKEALGKDELLDKWLSKELIFKFKGEEKDKLHFKESFSQLKDDQKEEARRRFNVLEPVIRGEILADEVKSYLDGLNIGKSQFYVWKKKWDTFQDIRALVPNKSGPTGPRNKVVYDLIKNLVGEMCYNGEKFTYTQLYQDLSVRIKEYNEFRLEKDQLPLIDKRTFERQAKTIIEQNRVDASRLGPVATKLRQNGSTKEVYVSRPLQRVEIDWTPVDVMLINPKTGKADRPNLIYSMDKCTGYPLGFYITFSDVNNAALKQCLLHTIMPKRYLRTLYPSVKNDWITYGVPEEVVFDNASVNDSLDIKDACYQINIQGIHFVGVGAGNQKGTIERGFRELNDTYIHSLKGTTFSNSLERGQYDSEGKACISLNAFIYMTHIVLVDIVAQAYDRKRRGTPAELWKKALDSNPHLSFPLTQTVEDLKLALMSGIEVRAITNKGVQIQNEYFQSSELMELRNRLISKYGHSHNQRVRFDLADMRKVYVWDEFKKGYIEAEQTGLERRGYTTSDPIHYSEMELDSFLSRHPNYKEEVINKGIAMREIKKIQEEESKEFKKSQRQKKQSEIENNSDAEATFAGVPNVEIVEGELIATEESKQEVDSNKSGKNKKVKSQVISASYDIDFDDLLDYGAIIREN